MLSKIYKGLLIAGTVILCTSCEDPVQVELNNGAQMYVIDAFVTDLGEAQVVKVNYSGVFFGTSDPQPVKGAAVKIRDLNTGEDFSFADSGKGGHVYVPPVSNPLAVIGHTYELNVTIGTQVYTARSVKHRTAIIRTINWEYFDGSGGFGGSPFYSCTLVAKDTVDATPDYYWIKTFRNDTSLFGPNDINICIDGTGGPVNNIGVDTTNFTPPATFLGFASFAESDICRVQIHSISAEAYNFFIQASTQINNGGLFATTPENVKTNIVTPKGSIKAVGWFNMATVTEHAIKVGF